MRASLRRAARPLQRIGNAVVIAQHKPNSFLSPSTRPMGNKRFAVDLLTSANQRGEGWAGPTEHPRDVRGLECAGRLDADSTGLLLWSDSAELVQHIIGSQRVEKEYLVRVRGHADWSDAMTEQTLRLMRHGGIQLDGKPLAPAGVEWLNEDQLRFTLVEGRHRQIRRMCELVGLRVEAIKRVRIGGLRLGALPVGYWAPVLPANAASLLLAPQGGGGAARAPSRRAASDGEPPTRQAGRRRDGRHPSAAPGSAEAQESSWAPPGKAAKAQRRRKARARREAAERAERATLS